MTHPMIRPATLVDVPAVSSLEAEAFGVDAWSEQQVIEELTGPRRLAWVAEGAGYLVVLQGDVLDLQRIAVAPGARRRGVARALLAQAPAGRMLLEVSAANVAARAFYEREGFAEIDRRRRYYRDGSDAIVMERL